MNDIDVIIASYSQSLFMSDNPQRTYEIGHFECKVERLIDRRVVKFIVCEVTRNIHYVFHLDSNSSSHEGISWQAEKTHPQYRNADILGGGRLALSNAGGPQKLELKLTDYSRDYGQEPDEIRAAFTPIVAEKLRQLGLNIENSIS
jgi:hypothetical protein